MNANFKENAVEVSLENYAEIQRGISEVKRVSAMSLQERINYYRENYGEKTAAKSIFCPSLGCYISAPLVYQNSKLRGIWIFDLLAVATYVNCSECKHFCYALKAQRQYLFTLLRRSIYTWLAKHDLAFLKRIIVEQLMHENGIQFVRIHSSGDFFSAEYLAMWTDIARAFPAVKFYYYTKADKHFNFDGFNALENVNGVKSILPDGERNFDKPARVHAIVEKYARRGIDVKICPYHDPATANVYQVRRLNRSFKWTTRTIKEYPEIHCGSDCTYCMDHEYVIFYIH